MKIARKVLFIFLLFFLTGILIQGLSNPLKTYAVRKMVTVGLEDDGTRIRNFGDLNESTGGISDYVQDISSIDDTYEGLGFCSYMTDAGEKKVIAYAMKDNGEVTINNCTINQSNGQGFNCDQSTRTIEDNIKDVGHFCFMDSSGNKKLVGVKIMDNGEYYRNFCDLNESTAWGDNCIEYGPIGTHPEEIIAVGKNTFMNTSGQRKVSHVILRDNGNWERKICDLNESTGGSTNCLGSGSGTISDQTVAIGYYVVPIEEEWGLGEDETDDDDDNDNDDNFSSLPQTAMTTVPLSIIISFGISGLILFSIIIFPNKSKIFSKIFFKK